MPSSRSAVTANASFMAGEGKWLSKVRRFLACGEKSLSNDSGKRTFQERRRGRRKLKLGERNSFVSLFKVPTSSIEKILEDAETEQGLTHRPPSPLEQPKKPTVALPEAASPKASASCSVSPKFYTPKAASPRVLSPRAKSPGAHSLRVVIPSAPSTRARSSGKGSEEDVSPGSPKVPSPVAILPKARSARYASSRVSLPVDLSPTPTPPRPCSSRPSFSKAASVKGIHREESISRIEPVFAYHHVAATKIQAAYRGYMSRMSTGSVRGLVRLQQFARGQSVKRQTASSTKHMQLLVRVKTRLQPQSFQMLECDALHQQQCLGDKQAESILSDAGNNNGWDDSILSKEEKEERNKRKEDTVRNKERARTLLQSHQMSKFTTEAASNALMDLHIDGLQWSWNWSERHLLKTILPRHQDMKKDSSAPPMSGTPRSSIAPRRNQYLTPRTSQSRTPSRFSQVQTPDRTLRSHYSSPSLLPKYSKPAPKRSQSPSDLYFTDTDSLRSSSAYSVPRYMTPTASARAKMRLSDNFNYTYTSSPSTESKRRLSYPLTPRSGTSRGGLFPDCDTSSQRTVRTNHSSRSVSNLTASSPGSFPDGRKPFNRFV